MANKISVLIDVATDKAVSGLKGFKQSITDADGSVNKFKAGASSAFDSIKANAGNMAMVAGAAIVAFGVKAVSAFQDIALEAGKFSDISGLAVEDASRWLEVGDHIGITAGVMEKSFGKLNAAIARGGDVLKEYGIEVVTAADGTVDANATFLAAIDTIKAIEDPTKKAQAAQAAFGKGWQEMSELIELGSGEILTQMGKVSDAKLVDEEELAKARKLRGSLDDLHDSVEDLSLLLGESLIPTVTMTADALTFLIEPLSAVHEWSKNVATSFYELVGIMDELPGDAEAVAGGVARISPAMQELHDKADEVAAIVDEVVSGFKDEADAAEKAAEKSEELTDGLQALSDSLSAQADAYADNAAAALDWMGEVQESMESAGGSISEFTDEALADIDTFQQELSNNVEKLNNWQNDIVSIAAQTSPEFAGFLADMGIAGADLVSDLEGNKGELETTFEQWKVAAAVAGRDVPAEIAKADPETQRIIERLGRNVIDTLGVAVTPTKTAARAVGTAIVDGMRAGVDGGAQAVARSAAAVVNQALTAAQSAGDIHSPSQLFHDEVGAPIAEGIEEGIIEGADKIGKALERSIKDAEKDALNAVDDLVDAAKDRFNDAWDSPDSTRSLERLNERISDATIDVADAQTKVNEAAAEFGVNSPEYARAVEGLSDSQRSLLDANYALLKASEDLIAQGPAGLAMFNQIGVAAGLTGVEINGLVDAYLALGQAQRDAAVLAATIGDEAAAANDTRARFGNAAAAGLVPQSWIDHISQFTNDPRFVVELMNAFLGTLPHMAAGGLVPGRLGQSVPIVAHAGEYITPHNAIASGWGGSSGAAGGSAVMNLTVNAGMGADGHQIAHVIVNALGDFVRVNGPGPIRTLVGV